MFDDENIEIVNPIPEESSIPLDDGGDTHFHSWDSGDGTTVTTRLPDDVDFHQDFDNSGNSID